MLHIHQVIQTAIYKKWYLPMVCLVSSLLQDGWLERQRFLHRVRPLFLWFYLVLAVESLFCIAILGYSSGKKEKRFEVLLSWVNNEFVFFFFFFVVITGISNFYQDRYGQPKCNNEKNLFIGPNAKSFKFPV